MQNAELTHLVVDSHEAALIELPGEQWVGLFDPMPESSFFKGLTNGVSLPRTAGCSPVISGTMFMKALREQPQNRFLQELSPFIRQALDTGYNHIIFRN